MRTYGFLVGIEVEGDEPQLELMAQRLADTVRYIDDVVSVDVDSLGEVDCYDHQTVGEEVI